MGKDSKATEAKKNSPSSASVKAEACPIVTAVRLRPVFENRGTLHPLQVEGDTLIHSHQHQTLEFDYAFGSDASNECVFAKIGTRAIKDTLSGYNSCIMAVGARGTGRTHSIFGHKDTGFVGCCLHEIFKETAKKKAENNSYCAEVEMSYFEIRKKKVVDLLYLGPEGENKFHSVQGSSGETILLGVERHILLDELSAMGIVHMGTRHRLSHGKSANDIVIVFHVAQSWQNPVSGAKEHMHSHLTLMDPRCVNDKKIEDSILHKVTSTLNNSASKVRQGDREDDVIMKVLEEPIGGNCRTYLLAHAGTMANDHEIQYLQKMKGARAIVNKPQQNPLPTEKTYNIILHDMMQRNRMSDNSNFVSLVNSLKQEISRISKSHQEKVQSANKFYTKMQQQEKDLQAKHEHGIDQLVSIEIERELWATERQSLIAKLREKDLATASEADWKLKLIESENQNRKLQQIIHDHEMKENFMENEVEEYRSRRSHFEVMEQKVGTLEATNEALHKAMDDQINTLRKELSHVYENQVVAYRQKLAKVDKQVFKLEQLVKEQQKKEAEYKCTIEKMEEQEDEAETMKKLADIKGKIYQEDSVNYRRMRTLLRVVVVTSYIRNFKLRKNLTLLHDALFRANLQASSTDKSKNAGNTAGFKEPYESFSGKKRVTLSALTDAVFRLFYLLQHSIEQFQETEKSLKNTLESQENRLSKLLEHVLEKEDECRIIRKRYHTVQQKLYRMCETSANRYQPQQPLPRSHTLYQTRKQRAHPKQEEAVSPSPSSSNSPRTTRTPRSPPTAHPHAQTRHRIRPKSASFHSSSHRATNKNHPFASRAHIARVGGL